MNVLIILGHPRTKSFSEALANAYKVGALNAGMNVKQINISEMKFEPNVLTISPKNQHFEEDINTAQNLITWADHIVFVYPTWWGTMPALLKAFLDRVLTPGFAFEDIHGSANWIKLLKGKSAQLITTMDTPLWVFRWLHKRPGHNALAKSTLQYCGISPIKTLTFSPINNSSKKERSRWLKKTEQKGFQLKEGFFSKEEKFVNKIMVWLKAVRLQFYPMTWIAYAAGAYGASSLGYTFDRSIFWLGYLWLFLLEVATVLSNEYYDYETDRNNKYFGPFTGGSRVLVEKELTFKEIKRGALLSMSLSVFAATILLGTIPNPFPTALLMAVLFIIALGYTVPPLKFSYRGLGELDVAITHSFGVILCGFVFQGGSLIDSFPWLLSIPLFLALFPSIILAGIPDYNADQLALKHTIPVHLGKKRAARLAIAFTITSALSATSWYLWDIVPGAFGVFVLIILLHGATLTILLYKYIKLPSSPHHINLLLFTALTYIIWFGIIPLLKFH